MVHLKDEPSTPWNVSPSVAPSAPLKPAPALPSFKIQETQPKEPAEKQPVDETQVNIAAPGPLDPTGWQPFPKERWDEALKVLREEEFLLYCALMDARPFVDEAAGGRLVLDITHRYCYEFLRLDRCRSLLKSALAPFHEGKESVLRHEGLWTSCDVQESRDVRQKDPRKRNSRAREPEITGFETVESKQETGGKEDPAKGIPFDGLVREVTRWLRGDVILVRRGVEEEDSDEELSGED